MNNEEIKNKIAELEKSDDIRDLFLAMKLVSNTFDEDLLSDFIKKYKDKIYKKDPILFIGYHVNFYVLQEKYIEALQVLKCYQNEPFINLTTDDFMNDLEKEIKKLMTPTKQHKYSLLDAEQDIYSQNEDKLSKAISFLSQYNVRNCLPFFKDALISSISYYSKILLQFILIEQSVNDVFKVSNEEKEFEFNPSQTLLPFDRENYKNVSNYIKNQNESPSVINTAIEILNTLEVKMFPSSITNECEEYENIGEILIFVAKKYLLENPSFSKLVYDTQMTEIDLNKIINNINAKIA
ncbi:MAG: hypothetical protein V8R16_03880 [Bacilli bacterium]